MFSDLTDHINSWMKSTENQEEDSLVPKSNNSAQNAPKKSGNPTKDMLMKMKNEIDSWLGIKKHEESEDVIFQQPGNDGIPTEICAEEIITDQLLDSTNSSNSNINIGKKDEPFKEVTAKAFATTKSFGNMLVSAVNVAGNKIRKTFEGGAFLSELINEQRKQAAEALPPWSDCSNEDILKEECLNLSNDSRNFIRNPPSGVDFYFDYDVSYPIAIATMKEDPKLEKIRFELVPKIITEEKFWRNYFYRVSLLRQAHELLYMKNENDQKNLNENQEENTCRESSSQNEFISDCFRQTSSDVNLLEDLRKFSAQETTQEEWEKELEVELDDYLDTEKKETQNDVPDTNIDNTNDNICTSIESEV